MKCLITAAMVSGASSIRGRGGGRGKEILTICSYSNKRFIIQGVVYIKDFLKVVYRC
uniref:Uncharacterized protein n=1 Tax=Amphimedon queenslandica TaxID=400682 RepID=A0A1X7SI19_AMPQE